MHLVAAEGRDADAVRAERGETLNEGAIPIALAGREGPVRAFHKDATPALTLLEQAPHAAQHRIDRPQQAHHVTAVLERGRGADASGHRAEIPAWAVEHAAPFALALALRMVGRVLPLAALVRARGVAPAVVA